MYERKLFLSSNLIIERVEKIQELADKKIPENKRFKMNFSNGWLYKFQKRHNFKCYRSFGEDNDADETEISNRLAVIHASLSKYAVSDIWNADEFGLFYSIPLRQTFASGRLVGRKN